MSDAECANERYIREVSEEIENCIDGIGCQPILFIGSGFSRRYMGAPDWLSLLRQLHGACPLFDKPMAFYVQEFRNDLPRMGSFFAEKYRHWAWSTGRESFPKHLFEEGVRPDSYIKNRICEQLRSLVEDEIEAAMQHPEIEKLQAIRPHAIITTNYDQALEKIFPNYEAIVRQKILRSKPEFYGEIMKIHGCVTDPSSLVFTHEDYKDYESKHKYLSAKLLTYFAEHPLFFIGYSASDSNIRQLLSDIDEIVSEDRGLITNIFIVLWQEEISPSDLRSKEQAIELGHKVVTIRKIITSNFGWVFDAIGSKRPINNFNPRVLRSILARNYNLIRNDIPKATIELDFTTLERAASNTEEFAKIYGIGDIGAVAQINLTHPFLLTEVAKQIGYDTWHGANTLLDNIHQENGVNIKSSNNKYHIEIKSGTGKPIRRYSADMVDILRKAKSGEPYSIEL